MSSRPSQRLTFADENITKGRGLISAPSAGPDRAVSTPSVGRRCAAAVADAARRRRQRRHRHQPCDRRHARRDRRHPAGNRFGRNAIAAVGHPAGRCARGLRATSRCGPSTTPGPTSDTDPLGTFTRLTKADADLDRVLENVVQLSAEAREAGPGARPGAVRRAVADQGGIGVHRHPARQHRPRGPHPTVGGRPPIGRRAGQEDDQSDRGNCTRQRCGIAGRPGAVVGQ